jgi:hypothetical protein
MSRKAIKETVGDIIKNEIPALLAIIKIMLGEK